jgi:hypothetical protein
VNSPPISDAEWRAAVKRQVRGLEGVAHNWHRLEALRDDPMRAEVLAQLQSPDRQTVLQIEQMLRGQTVSKLEHRFVSLPADLMRVVDILEGLADPTKGAT